MNTFDQVGEINADTTNDVNAFALSTAVTKEAAQQSIPPEDIYALHFNDSAFNAQLDNAYRSHITAKPAKARSGEPTS